MKRSEIMNYSGKNIGQKDCNYSDETKISTVMHHGLLKKELNETPEKQQQVILIQ